MIVRAALSAALSLWVLIGGAAHAQSAPGPAAAASASPEQLRRGQRLFLRCSACHDLTDATVARIGPNLSGVVGRKAGTLADYHYSAALKNSSLVWDAATLDRWLTDPAALVPGTAMAFGGLPNPADRQAIIAYLANPTP